jgi:pimeloyl-ACP methyl ester carboxylesterase
MRMRKGPVVLLALAGLAAGAAVIGPGGAEADPGLARFYRQQIDWHGCQTGSEDDLGQELDAADARCGEVTVPLDYSRPNGRTITVALSRLPAGKPAQRAGVLLLNGGGPGAGSMDLPLFVGTQEPVRARFDLIGMDPRFVGRSTPLDCGWPTGHYLRSAGTDRRDFDRMVGFAADLARRCAERAGDVLPHVSTRNTARDMDVVRAALGERRLSYLGFSYGTYLGAVYTQMFPDRAGRIVLDSAVSPVAYGPRLLLENARPLATAMAGWAGWAARHDEEYGLGDSGRQVLETVNDVYAAAGERPLHVGEFTVDEHLLPHVLIDGLTDDRDEPRAEFAGTIRVLQRAARGETVAPEPALAEFLRDMLTGRDSAYGSQQISVLCGDKPAPRDPEVYWRQIEASRTAQPLFGPLATNINPCAFWPTAPRERPTRIGNDVPAMIVQSERDPVTWYEHGLVMHDALPPLRTRAGQLLDRADGGSWVRE